MQNSKEAVELPGMAYRAWFLFVLVLVSASVNAERYMMVVLVEPMRKELGLSDSMIGVVKDLALAVVYVLAIIPMARLADRWSKRKVVAIAAVVWSLACVLCSQARNFWILLVGRAGIGLGEGSYTPPSQSWIADLFPMKQRASAMAIFLLGSSAGVFLGPAAGGALAQEYGWRMALLCAAIPGLVLAPIVWFTLRDVPLGLADGHHNSPSGQLPFWETIKQLLAIPTMPWLIGSAALNALLTMGLVSWAPAFMERSHDMPMREAGAQMGSALFLGSLIGHSVGGPLADWLGRRDLRWYVWLLMLVGAFAAISAWFLLAGPPERVFPMFGLNMLIGGMSAAPLLAVIAGLSPAQSRSTAVALLMLAINVIGLGIGPWFVGFLSDMLRPEYGEASLGIAMKSVLIVAVPSTIMAYIASTHFVSDFAAAGHDPGDLKSGMPAGH